MNHKRTLLSLLLALALSLTACGKSAPAEEEVPQDDVVQGETSVPEEMVGGGETAAPDIRPAGPGVEATGTPAVTEGELVYTMDYDQGLLDGSGASGWFVTFWLAKGYGTRYYAVNPATGQVIQGEEGAPVVICGQGLIRFVWKGADGNEVSADTVYFMEGEPQTYTLYAQIYGLDGQLREEREVMTWTQTGEDPYYMLVYPAIEVLVEELGGGYAEGHELVLNVTDEGGDAVIRSKDGGELIRLPGVDASGIYAYASADDSYVSVYRTDSDQTEFYRF